MNHCNSKQECLQQIHRQLRFRFWLVSPSVSLLLFRDGMVHAILDWVCPCVKRVQALAYIAQTQNYKQECTLLSHTRAHGSAHVENGESLRCMAGR